MDPSGAPNFKERRRRIAIRCCALAKRVGGTAARSGGVARSSQCCRKPQVSIIGAVQETNIGRDGTGPISSKLLLDVLQFNPYRKKTGDSIRLYPTLVARL